MKLNQMALATVFVAVLAAPSVFAQSTGNPQSPSRDAVKAEAIRSHQDGTMQHGEYAPKSKPFASTKSRQEVDAEAISSHKDGTMLHSEVAPKSEPFHSTLSRKQVSADAVLAYKAHTIMHGEAEPNTPLVN